MSFPDLHPPFTNQEAVVEANRCLYCADAPCTAACPTHIDVPKFIKKIATGNLKGSAQTILEANILGASCARVCPVDILCEGSCVMHRFNREPIEIGRLQRHAMETQWGRSLHPPKPKPAAKPLTVACIGAGPASLACAAELVRRGNQAVIYESKKLPGGLNTYGVAEYKLRTPEALKEIDLIRNLGVEIRTGETIDNARLKQLSAEYDAIFLGLGLGRMEPLGIPGEGLTGVIDALRLIADYKTAQTIQVRGRVVIIGAGNTAIDAAIAALRLGAERATIVYRRTEREMPAFPSEYEHAKKEGVNFCWSAKPLRILGENGRVTGIECSSFTIVCDMVIPAIGQSKTSTLLNGIPGLDFRNGLIAVDRATGQAGNPKFYAGGDIVNGGREVVDAVADGKRAALSMVHSHA